LLGAALPLGGCGGRVQVETAVSPDANLSRLRTFRIMPAPERRQARGNSLLEPMVSSSSTSRALRDAIRQTLEARGYQPAREDADFSVAYYATAREKLDVTTWNYGYAWRPRWWRGWGPRYADVTEYNEGTVIIDVVDPSSHELLWRGRGISRVSDDPEQYQRELMKAVTAILDKFPGRGANGDR
jgi:hypothetical protein